MSDPDAKGLLPSSKGLPQTTDFGRPEKERRAPRFVELDQEIAAEEAAKDLRITDPAENPGRRRSAVHPGYRRSIAARSNS